MTRFIGVVGLLAVLLFVGAGHGRLEAIAPGIDEVSQAFVPHAVTNTFPIMQATTVGGLIVYDRVESFCGTNVVRVSGDPARVLTVNGAPIPSDGYPLLTRDSATLYNPETGLCDIPNPAHSSTELMLGVMTIAAGARQLSNGHTQITIATFRMEGGCAFINQLGGPECVLQPGATDFSGDGDVMDWVVAYVVGDVDPATKDVSFGPVVTTGVQADTMSLVSDGTTIGLFIDEASLTQYECRSLGGNLLACESDQTPGTDLNGDGMAMGARVLHFLDPATGTVRNTSLSQMSQMTCPTSPLLNDFTSDQVDLVRMGDGVVAFPSHEVEPQPAIFLPGPPGGPDLSCPAKPGRDYNGDGDYVDRVIRFIQIDDPIGTVHLGPVVVNQTPGGFGFTPAAAGLLGVDASHIAYAIAESGMPSAMQPCLDLSGDCDQNDAVLQIYDIASGGITNSGAVVSQGLLMPGPRNAVLANGIVAFLTREFDQGKPLDPMVPAFTDYNGDGDATDTVLRFFEIDANRVVTTDAVFLHNDAMSLDSAYFAGTDGELLSFIRGEIFDIPVEPFTTQAPGALFYLKRSEGTGGGAGGGGGEGGGEGGGGGGAADTDSDGIADDADNCTLAPNADQTDSDADGQGNACDADDDNDVVPDGSDNCALVANADQTDSDGDALGNACDADDDNDGAADALDNCALLANADQTDSDGDGQGNACDADDDGDGVADAVDNCALTANGNQADGDGDGTGDACDANPNDGPSGDLDGDGFANNVDGCPTQPGTANGCPPPPPPPGDALDALVAQVNALAGNAGLRQSLLAKLNAARASRQRGNATAAGNQLRAFVNEVNALERSRRIDAATAAALRALAQTAIGQL